ncbi:UDP-N-acetylmuramate dehydrogenase [Patescibacteria group bacterium]|nr:UDP-N-acetylmuramate dehydrogenase [Patescibacteria group bacterium]
MLKIKKQVDLSRYNTLKISVKAAYFAIIKSETDLAEAYIWAKDKGLSVFVLGGGSNVLFSHNIKALVLKNEIKGVSVIKETAASAWLEARSGEAWSTLVNFAIERNWGGMENLYYVPGTVGAAPVQNIGAYGVELKDVFVSLRAFDLQTGKVKIFNKEECKFAYRDSVFKHKYKGRYFILSITVKLSKQAKLKLDYGDIKLKLKEQGIKKPKIRQLAEIIRQIRDSKLPNPAELANAGSFFKNPEVSLSAFKKIQGRFPEIKFFPSAKAGKIKIPAGWLIEQVGLKGKRFGSVAMYEKQALILVNYGGASAKQILTHVQRVQKAVEQKFAIKIEPEVNIIK